MRLPWLLMITTLGFVGGALISTDNYLSRVRATPEQRERIVGLFVYHTLPSALIFGSTGLVVTYLLTSGKKPSDAAIAQRFAESEMSRRDLPTGESLKLADFAAYAAEKAGNERTRNQ